MNSTGNPQLILIVGCRRSGTTLLRAVLSQHPDLVVHPDEPQFIKDYVHKYGYHVNLSTQDVALIEKVCAEPMRLYEYVLSALRDTTNHFIVDMSLFAQKAAHDFRQYGRTIK